MINYLKLYVITWTSIWRILLSALDLKDWLQQCLHDIICVMRSNIVFSHVVKVNKVLMILFLLRVMSHYKNIKV